MTAKKKRRADTIKMKTKKTTRARKTKRSVQGQSVIHTNLLEKARTQWQFGEWSSLARLDLKVLKSHPDRAELALYAAAGKLQQPKSEPTVAKQLLQDARRWGLPEEKIRSVLISGVYTSLARARALQENKQSAVALMRTACEIGFPRADTRLLLAARLPYQTSQLGMPQSRWRRPVSEVESILSNQNLNEVDLAEINQLSIAINATIKGQEAAAKTLFKNAHDSELTLGTPLPPIISLTIDSRNYKDDLVLNLREERSSSFSRALRHSLWLVLYSRINNIPLSCSWLTSQFPRKDRWIVSTLYKTIGLPKPSDEIRMHSSLHHELNLGSTRISPKSLSETSWRLKATIFEMDISGLRDYIRTGKADISDLKSLAHRLKTSQNALTLPPQMSNNVFSWLWNIKCLCYQLEATTLLLLSKMAPQIAWFIDGGAHIGYITSIVNTCNQHCLSYAIEPNSDLFPMLEQNTKTFNATHLEAGLAARNSVGKLYRGTGHSNSSLIPGATTTTLKPIDINTICLDDIAASLPGRGLIKLDIEGFELDALMGAKNLLKKGGVWILLEINPRLLKKKQEPIEAVSDFLASHGYQGRRVSPDFSLGPQGVVDYKNTENYLFADHEGWHILRQFLC